MASLNHPWLRLLCTTWLLWHAYALSEQTGCEDSVATRPGASAGRPLLGQGIALFEAHDLTQAERTLQTALDAGLPDAAERASAHKYLAFSHCMQRQWTRCESAFEAAFAAHASFALQAYEITGTPWGQAYSRAQERRTQSCPQTTRPAMTTRAAAPSGGFTLNSRVITSIAPLVPASVSTLTRAIQPPRTDHNLRLRISPWAHVRIDGRPAGVTPPLVLLKLPAGTHTVELLSPGFESFRQVIELTDGQPVILSHDFDAR